MDQSCDIGEACNLFRSLVLILSFEFDTSIVVARQSFNPYLKSKRYKMHSIKRERERERDRDRERMDGMDDARW